MREKIRIMISGASNPHIPGYCRRFANNSNSPWEIIAIAEENEKLLNNVKEILKEKKVQFYSNWQEMFDKCANYVDAIQIGSDNIHHFKQITAAVDLNKHIYSTKVVTMDEDEGAKLLEYTKNYKKIIQVELELHFSAQFQRAKELIHSGELGNIQSIYLTNISISPCNYFPNWGDPLLSYGKVIPIRPNADYFRGGALTDHPHPFDLIRWMTGNEFKTVYAQSAINQRSHLKVEDHIAITGKLNNGVRYFINPSYSNLEEKVPTRILRSPKSLECNLKIVGDKAQYMTDYNINPIFVIGKDHPSPNRYMVENSPNFKKNRTLESSFADSIIDNEKVEATLADGLAAVKVMNAAYDSVYNDSEIVLK